MTQRELALALNVHTNTINWYEAGVRKPNLSNMRKIAEYFDCPLRDIFRSVEPELYDMMQSDQRESELVNDAQEMWSIWKVLNHEQKNTVLTVARSYVMDQQKKSNAS